MRESGVVIKNDGEGIVVRMQKSLSCEGCHACQFTEGKEPVLHIRQQFSVKPGERVEIEIKPAFAVTSALLLFLLPLLMLLGGYFLFQKILPADGIDATYRGMIGALTGFILSYIFIYFYDRRIKKDFSCKNIYISRIIKE